MFILIAQMELLGITGTPFVLYENIFIPKWTFDSSLNQRHHVVA